MSEQRAAERETLDEKGGWELPEYEVDRLLATGDDPRLRELLGVDYEPLRDLASQAAAGARTRRRKTVIFLPGILGSSLGKPRTWIGNDTIWLDPVSLAFGGATDLRLTARTKVKSLGVLPIYHNYIRFRLMIAGFRVVSFHYDWRKSIPELGQALVDFVEQQRVDEVMLVAHSMGGLVSRAALAIGSEKVRRLIMLGTPNHGSFSPVQVLQAINSTVQLVAKIDQAHHPVDLVKSTFSSFPSLYEMLPRPEVYDTVDLFNRSNWPTKPYRPAKTRLNAVGDTWDHIASPDERFYLIGGFGQKTVTDLHIAENGEFEYFESVDGGDGTVPLAMCQLEDVPTRYASLEHVGLLKSESVSKAVIDLLSNGETDRLEDRPTISGPGVGRWLKHSDFESTRGAISAMRRAGGLTSEETADLSRAALMFSSLPAADALEQSQVGTGKDDIPFPSAGGRFLSDIRVKETVLNRDLQSQLDIELVQGSLFDVPYRAIVLGIFEDVDAGGPATMLDKLMGGAVQEMIERRMFDGSTGRVFVMPTGRNLLKCEHVVFMGLGAYADFIDNSAAVVRTASGNTLRTLLRCGVEELATVIYGGGSGLAIRDAVKNMIGGYLDSVASMKGQKNRAVFRRLGLCEIDEDRFAELKEEVIRFAFTDDSRDVRLRLHEPDYSSVRLQLDESRRPPSQDEGTSTQLEDGGLKTSYLTVRVDPCADDPNEWQLHASLLTSGGNAAVYPSMKFIDREELDQRITQLQRCTMQEFRHVSQELRDLLFTEDFCSLLDYSPLTGTHLAVIHNALASRVPWEVLLLGQENYPCLESGVSRRYETDGADGIAKYLCERQIAEELNILLVVDPTSDLPGARAEGDVVRSIVGAVNGSTITALEQQHATRPNILELLGSARFDVLHYAGHAFFDPENRRRSGLVCAGEDVLRSEDIQRLDKLPSLVFFNACESGRVRKRDPAIDRATVADKREQNVGIAEALLRSGVTQFVGTYWPVGDVPAKLFAERFYRSLNAGEAVYQAVLKGREGVFKAESVDFANYLHYGTPSFRVKRRRLSG